MATKDTRLEEKEQYVVHGDIFADSFRDRETGKPVGESSKSAWEIAISPNLVYDSTGSQIVASKKVHIEGQDANGVGLVVDEKSVFEKEIEIGDSSTTTHSVLLGVHGDAQIHGELMLDALSHLQNTNGDPLFKVLTAAEWEEEVTKVGVVYFVLDTTTHKCEVYYYNE